MPNWAALLGGRTSSPRFQAAPRPLQLAACTSCGARRVPSVPSKGHAGGPSWWCALPYDGQACRIMYDEQTASLLPAAHRCLTCMMCKAYPREGDAQAKPANATLSARRAAMLLNVGGQSASWRTGCAAGGQAKLGNASDCLRWRRLSSNLHTGAPAWGCTGCAAGAQARPRSAHASAGCARRPSRCCRCCGCAPRGRRCPIRRPCASWQSTQRYCEHRAGHCAGVSHSRAGPAIQRTVASFPWLHRLTQLAPESRTRLAALFAQAESTPLCAGLEQTGSKAASHQSHQTRFPAKWGLHCGVRVCKSKLVVGLLLHSSNCCGSSCACHSAVFHIATLLHYCKFLRSARGPAPAAQ